jgi:RNA 3'-terminal phosphate cyclase (ATP)
LPIIEIAWKFHWPSVRLLHLRADGVSTCRKRGSFPTNRSGRLLVTQDDVITIDGSMGEGGGQILRTSLTLSLVTGKPFRLERIRAGRQRPGLLRQHLTAVRAAAEVGRATVDGATIGSQRLSFVPGAVRPGEYRFAVGSAGSATLVFQTVLPALMLADAPSRMTVEGGTHNAWAPPFDFLKRAFLPLLGRMEPRVEAVLDRPGFYPAGGGALTATIEPASQLRRIDLLTRGAVLRRTAHATVSRLPLSVARREVQTLREQLALDEADVAVDEVDSPGPGNVVSVLIECEQVTEVFTGIGQKGVPAEKVARSAAIEARRYLAADVPVGQHLADQLLIPMVLAGGGVFRSLAPSRHTETNIDVIRRFMDVDIRCEEIASDDWRISIGT